MIWDGESAPRGQVVAGRGPGRPSPPSIIPVPSDEEAGPGEVGPLAEFVHAVETGRRPQTICTDNIKSLAMVIAAMGSAGTKTRVGCLTWQEDHPHRRHDEGRPATSGRQVSVVPHAGPEEGTGATAFGYDRSGNRPWRRSGSNRRSAGAVRADAYRSNPDTSRYRPSGDHVTNWPNSVVTLVGPVPSAFTTHTSWCGPISPVVRQSGASE